MLKVKFNASEVPIEFVADTDPWKGEQILGVEFEVIGWHKMPLVGMPVRLAVMPVISTTSTSKFSTGNSSWVYALTHRKVPLKVTSGLLGGPACNA